MSSSNDEDEDAHRLALEALSEEDAMEALRIATAASRRGPKAWHSLVAARAHYVLGDLRSASSSLAEAASSSSSSSGGEAAALRNGVAAVSLRERKPHCALLLCRRAEGSPSPPSGDGVHAATTYNRALASVLSGEAGPRGVAEELESLAQSLDSLDPRPSRRAAARVWLRAAEALAKVAAGDGGGAEREKEEKSEPWERVARVAETAAELSSGDGGDPRCRSAALSLVAASRIRLGKLSEAREAIREALDDGSGDCLLPGARSVLELYSRAIESAPK